MVIRLQQNNKMEVTKVLHYTSSSDVTSLFSKSDSSSLTFENGIKRAHPSNLPTVSHFSEDRTGKGTKSQVW